MKKISIFVSVLILCTFALAGCGKVNNTAKKKPDEKQAAVPKEQLADESVKQPATASSSGTQAADLDSKKKLCGWIDESDVIIKVNIPEGITKDSSYEAGFYLSQIKSNMRVARAACDYRTGFKFSELKNLGAVQMGVRGYSDNRRRQLENEPISVVFDNDGKPSIGTNIEVTIKD
jgi:hypothetical protein